MAIKLVRKLPYKVFIQYWWAIIGVFVIAFIAIYYFSRSFMQGSSFIAHFSGLVSGLSTGGLFGKGMGKAGVLTTQLAGLNDWLAVESYFGLLVAQIGWFGLICFLVFFIFVSFHQLKKYKFGNDKLILASVILLYSVLFEALFSESSITSVGSGLYFILAGVTLHLQENGMPVNS